MTAPRYPRREPIATPIRTTTTLTWTPDEVAINKPFDLVATVGGPDTTGEVEFFDGEKSLGTAPTEDGVATLTVPGLKAGTHLLSAVFGQTDTAQASTSNVITFALSRGQSSLALSVSSGTATYGTKSTATVSVPGGEGGTVTVDLDGTATEHPVPADGVVVVALPTKLAVGSHTVTASFSGTDDLAESGPIAASYVVTRAPIVLKAAATSSVQRGTTFKVGVRASGSVAGTPITGDAVVQVAIGNGAWRTVGKVKVVGGRADLVVTATSAVSATFLRIRTALPASATYLHTVSPETVVSLRR